MDERCTCDPNDLLAIERQYSRLTPTLGGVWCATHRVWVTFTAPKEAFDARIAVAQEVVTRPHSRRACASGPTSYQARIMFRVGVRELAASTQLGASLMVFLTGSPLPYLTPALYRSSAGVDW